jgi:hypothetical protein
MTNFLKMLSISIPYVLKKEIGNFHLFLIDIMV